MTSTTPRCDTCRYWTEPLRPQEPVLFTGRTTQYGVCNRAGYTAGMLVTGPLGCSECEPYTSIELNTKGAFGCVEWKGRD